MWGAADLQTIPTREELYAALCERHGEELQKRFDKACVAVCGLGGLGSNIAVSLARAGVGRLILIDFDRVDISNLNRQQYNISQLGMYKTEALKNTLLSFSPYSDITIHTVRITGDNMSELLNDAEIICEAFDNPEQKALLVNGVSEQLPEKYLVAASGMAGLGSSNTIKTRRVTKRFYLCGDEQSDISDGGLISARVMLCAAHQANMILRIIAGESEV